MLAVEDLSVHFGEIHALDGMTFEVPSSRLVGFVGPNGSGKTTTMRTIVGLVEPQHGSVRWNDAPIDAVARRRIGYMPEERGLYLRWGVLDQVAYLGRLTGMSAADAKRSATKWLERVGLGDRLESLVQELSHGNQQRVQLAAALVHGPDLLLLDEPFAGLDPLGMSALAELLDEIAAGGATVLFSSHQLDIVEDLCRDVVVIAGGRCVARGDVDDLRARSTDRRVQIRFAEPVQWAPSVGTITATSARGVDLSVSDDADLHALVAEARARGKVQTFRFEPPDLSDVFRELVS